MNCNLYFCQKKKHTHTQRFWKGDCHSRMTRASIWEPLTVKPCGFKILPLGGKVSGRALGKSNLRPLGILWFTSTHRFGSFSSSFLTLLCLPHIAKCWELNFTYLITRAWKQKHDGKKSYDQIIILWWQLIKKAEHTWTVCFNFQIKTNKVNILHT